MIPATANPPKERGIKRYRIPFRADMLEAIENGKSETRRTNLNWLKVKKGDILLAHEGRYGKTAHELVATKDAYQECVTQMDRDQALAEGVVCDESAISFRYSIAGYTGASAVGAFRQLWDEINGGKPGMAWKDNPSPVVLTFERLRGGAK